MKKRSKLKFTLLSIIITFLLIIIWIWNRSIFNFNAIIDDNAFNSFGAFFGGVVGTIVLIVTLRVAYLTYQENAKNQIEIRYFQLLNMIANTKKKLTIIDNNIFETYIKNISTFAQLIEEIKQDEDKKSDKLETKKWNKEDIMRLGYLISFYGIVEFNDALLENIKTIKNDEVKEIILNLKNRGVEYNIPSFKLLGIYFRQLFQAVTYIDNKTELSYNEKYHLIKALRVQLNIDEQYLLFVNSLTSLGRVWEDKKSKTDKELITKYNIIKNIPLEYHLYENIDLLDPRDFYRHVQYESLYGQKSDMRKKLEKSYIKN